MKGRSPAAYALALRGMGKVMKHRNTPQGGRSLELENLQDAAEEELREETREEAERLAIEAAHRYGVDIPALGVVHSESEKEDA